MPKPADPRPTDPHAPDSPVRIITGDYADMDAAWLWLRGHMRHLSPDECEHELRQVPAIVALMAYSSAVTRSQDLIH